MRTWRNLLFLATLLLGVEARAYYVDFNTMSNYVASVIGGGGGGPSVPGTTTNNPYLYWTNNVICSMWSTNASFTIGQVGLPASNQWTAAIIVSNYGGGTLTATLPLTCYSISLATNVTAANVPAGTALQLVFKWNTNGTMYVIDDGQDSPALVSLAAAVLAANGVLVSSGGTVTSTTNPAVYNLTAQNIVQAAQFQNSSVIAGGLSIIGYDTLGTVQLNVFNRNGTNGIQINDLSEPLVDILQQAQGGLYFDDRYETRGGNLLSPGNTSGERQWWWQANRQAYWGTNYSALGFSLQAKSFIATNINASFYQISTNGSKPTAPAGFSVLWQSNAALYLVTVQHPNGVLIAAP